MPARPLEVESRAGRGVMPIRAEGDGLVFERAVLAAVLDPIVTVDSAGTIRSASDSVERVLGWRADELVGRNVSVLMPEPHRSLHDAYMAGYHRGGLSRVLGRRREFQAVRKDGSAIPIELCVTRVELGDRRDGAFVGIIRDVSERYRSEQALRLMQALTMDMSGADHVGEALSRTLREIVAATGWDYGEVWLYAGGSRTGAASPEMRRAACWPDADRRFAKLRAAGKGMRLESVGGRSWRSKPGTWLTRDDRQFDHEFVRAGEAAAAGVRAVASIPVRCEDEPVALLVFFVRNPRPEDGRLLDIAKAAVAPLGQLIRRKSAEEQLALHQQELERLVAARTTELEKTHVQLRMADRLASIGTLAAGLGHDMNNVLLPVRARLTALLAGGATGRLTPAARRNVEEIRRIVAYLQQLADGLHYLAMDPETEDRMGETTDLREWWSRVGTLIAKALPKETKLVCSVPRGLPAVTVAPHRLTQAVLNLVVNAGEAVGSKRRGRVRAGRVRVWARAEPDGTSVRLGIADNGPGMSDEVKRHAFEMFYTTKSRGMGTGLGLPLVHKIVSGAGGRVEIESKLGSGTTVLLTLPAAVGAARRDATSLVASVEVPDGREAAVIRQMLEAGGATVKGAGGGDGADIRIVDPRIGAPPRRRLAAGPAFVLMGQPPGESRAAWMAVEPPPLIIEDRSDLPKLRSALGRAMEGA